MRRLLALCVLYPGCLPVAPEAHDGPLSFVVTFRTPAGGETADAALPYSTEPREFAVDLQAIGWDREPLADFTANVAVHATPGAVVSAPYLLVEGGQAQATIRVANAFGAARIWFSDEGTPESPGSFATGAAPAVFIENPTIRESQESTSTVESPLEGSYVKLRGWQGDEPRDLRVHSVVNDGFYATDYSDPAGSFNSVFAFTFSRPDGLAEGDRLAWLSGIQDEFLGFTELSFPDWQKAEAPSDPLRGGTVLDPSVVCDGAVMEGFESAEVRVFALTSDFAGLSDCADYLEYGQWPARLPGTCGGEDARISVVNGNTVPGFRFEACADNQRPDDRTLPWLDGVLRHNRYASPAWMLEVRDCGDFPAHLQPPGCPASTPPRSGPRQAPEPFYRDVATCDGVPYRL